MTNKYLEKVAEWRHIGYGVQSNGTHYGVSKATGDRFGKEWDGNHRNNALKVLPAGFAATGALMGLGAGAELLTKNPKRVFKASGALGLAGAGIGLVAAPLLASAGAKQMSRETKINDRIRHYVGKIRSGDWEKDKATFKPD